MIASELKGYTPVFLKPPQMLEGVTALNQAFLNTELKIQLANDFSWVRCFDKMHDKPAASVA